MNNFSFKYSIKTSLNPEDQIAVFEMNRIYGEYVEKVGTYLINFKEQAVRDAMIELGWTPPEGAWQPIETAPKDGTIVLVYANVVFMATRLNGVWRKWSSELVLKPTHWQPLPEPPQ